MRKHRRKTEDSIDEKSLKLNEETRKKTDHLYITLQEVKNLQNLARKIIEENLMLIKDKNKTSRSKA